jgi:hypothetical protein
MILGLDVSTSITGATVLDSAGKRIFCEAWDTRKLKDLYTTAEEIECYLKLIKSEFEIEQIYIEQSLQSFRRGFSSAKTLSTLSKINGIVSWMCYSIWSIKPEHISAISARRSRFDSSSLGQAAWIVCPPARVEQTNWQGRYRVF